MDAALTYRTLDGDQDYTFLLVKQPDRTLRIYVLRQPGYNSRSTTSHETHRYFDVWRRKYYIDPPFTPRSKKQALRGAKLWAEATERYRKWGTRF